MTDPFTDVPAYYRSAGQMTSWRLVKDAWKKSFSDGYAGLTNDELPDGLNMGGSVEVVRRGIAKKRS